MRFFFLCLVILTLAGHVQNEDVEDRAPDTSSNPLFNTKTYSTIFAERRREHRHLTQQLLKYNYEKSHKLLKIGYSKMFELISESNKTLIANNYNPHVNGFALTDLAQLEALSAILENCCLAGEFLMHFPELSRVIFKKTPLPNWSSTLNWCIQFVNTFPHIIDESSGKLMELLAQEINEELRSEDYVNPYYSKPKEEQIDASVKKPKKPKKKLKKGPQLSGGDDDVHNEL